MILLMLKHNSADQKGTDSTFKEQALGLIKKILKKKAWELLAAQQKEAGKGNIISDDWICIKRGLMIYFGNKLNWSKDVYRVWREYITESKIRDEMARESPEVQAFVHAYSKK
jgi:hypothetical protein